MKASAALAVAPEARALGAIQAAEVLPEKMVKMGVGDPVDFEVGLARWAFLGVLEFPERTGNRAWQEGPDTLDVCKPAALHICH